MITASLPLFVGTRLPKDIVGHIVRFGIDRWVCSQTSLWKVLHSCTMRRVLMQIKVNTHIVKSRLDKGLDERDGAMYIFAGHWHICALRSKHTCKRVRLWL